MLRTGTKFRHEFLRCLGGKSIVRQHWIGTVKMFRFQQMGGRPGPSRSETLGKQLSEVGGARRGARRMAVWCDESPGCGKKATPTHKTAWPQRSRGRSSTATTFDLMGPESQQGATVSQGRDVVLLTVPALLFLSYGDQKRQGVSLALLRQRRWSVCTAELWTHCCVLSPVSQVFRPDKLGRGSGTCNPSPGDQVPL